MSKGETVLEVREMRRSRARGNLQFLSGSPLWAVRKQAIPGLFIFDLRFHCDPLLVAVVVTLLLLLLVFW